jgi:hypothetical protein
MLEPRCTVPWLLLLMAAWPRMGTAQPVCGAREVEITGAPNESAIAYGAPDIPLTLVFDAPLEVQDGGVVLLVPGVDARPHPFNTRALVVILSPALAGHGPVPLRVPLKGRVAAVTLELEPDKLDHVLRILRRPSAQRRTKAELEALRIVGDLLLGNGGATCGALPPSRSQPETIQQVPRNKDLLVCSLDSTTYLRVPRRRPQCRIAMARMTRAGQSVEVDLLGACEKNTCQLLAMTTPLEGADDYELELLEADGTVCERRPRVSLHPAGEL